MSDVDPQRKANARSERIEMLIYRILDKIKGPKNETVYDFWRMIWQEKIMLIIMLCNVDEKQTQKCYQYWPKKIGQTINLNQITLKTISVTFIENNNITVTKIKIDCDNKCRILYHRHWTTWPDGGVPTTTTEPFSLLQSAREQKSPVVVHCSAGIGRTGTLILIEIILSSLKQGKIPNSKYYVEVLRTHRAGAVQTEDQYAYAHYAIVQFLYHKKVFTQNDISGRYLILTTTSILFCFQRVFKNISSIN
ncbi:unnamed protein product [Thelazia callipaeda]|uniref:Protein-tyrosine phosphatase n=1 Tax=Thelazia callipaeda TaxID=103827 RepID=A0A0N5CQM0_THECL|nr:unnamed protein product [Thelazia callipaeda]